MTIDIAREDGKESLAVCVACVAIVLLFQYLVSARTLNLTLSGPARRQDLHLQRKAQHMGTGALIYAASRYFGQLTGSVVLLFFGALFYGLHELRGCSEAINTVYIKAFRNILRQNEVTRVALPGAYYFLLGSGLSLAIFPSRIARLAILHLSIGDPAAAFFGTLYGRHKFKTFIGKLGGNKSLEGSAGCFCVAAGATFMALMIERAFYFDVYDKIVAKTSTISLAAGFGAAAAELLNIGGWDDNITLPLLSSVFLQISVGNLLK